MIDYRDRQEDLFNDLARWCGAPGARPEDDVHVDCPFCGKEAKRGQTHFAFSMHGAYCFVCGNGCSLYQAARMLGLSGTDPYVPKVDKFFRTRAHAEPRTAKRAVAPEEWSAAQAQWAGLATKHLWEVWRAYKPLSAQTIYYHWLGYGSLNVGGVRRSQCDHARLIVPLCDADGNLCGARARSIPGLGCEEAGHPKWLSAAGTKQLLYNGGFLYRPLPTGIDAALFGRSACEAPLGDSILFIVENPVDALWLEQAHRADGIRAVATLGVSMWKRDWTRAIQLACPNAVIVAYDNDWPGNGGGQPGLEAWRQNHAQDIMPNGVRLVNTLLSHGIRAQLYDWTGWPLKADIGDVLAAEEEGGAQ